MISCNAGCRSEVENAKAAEDAGWSFLPISGGYRCGGCERELAAANHILGTNAVTIDTLDPKSRGALPKATAQTIKGPAEELRSNRTYDSESKPT